jgi:hypothetical protein
VQAETDIEVPYQEEWHQLERAAQQLGTDPTRAGMVWVHLHGYCHRQPVSQAFLMTFSYRVDAGVRLFRARFTSVIAQHHDGFALSCHTGLLCLGLFHKSGAFGQLVACYVDKPNTLLLQMCHKFKFKNPIYCETDGKCLEQREEDRVNLTH